MLYRRINLSSDEPVQFVGCYVLRWGKDKEPTVGFAMDVEATERLAKLETFAAEILRIYQAQPDRWQEEVEDALLALEKKDG